MKELSIVIPIYNEQENFIILFERLKNVISQLQVDTEYIFVNNGSRDQSLALIKELAGEDSSILFMDFSRNFGHQAAIYFRNRN